VRFWGVAVWGVKFRVQGLGCRVRKFPRWFFSFSAGLEPAGEREFWVLGVRVGDVGFEVSLAVPRRARI